MAGAGFYKRDGDQLLHAPNFVIHADYTLYRNNHNAYTYPVDGWTWYATAEAAHEAEGVPLPAPDDTS